MPLPHECNSRQRTGGQPSKRRYRNALTFVEEGLRTCWNNSLDLVAAAKQLLDNDLHAPALSLAVLALEELAKLFAFDGLLYARQDDHKSVSFNEANRSHASKLAMFELFPFFLAHLARLDPRFESDEAIRGAVAITLQNLQADRNAVTEHLETPGYAELDKWKQRGFYVWTTDSGPTTPRDVIDPEFARAVFTLAWRATTSIDYLFKNGNLERYIQKAQAVRGKLTESAHQALEKAALEVTEKLFDQADDEIDQQQ